ncbi:MAG: complex I subunit 1 family protein [Nitrososphaerota archaeon]
MGQALLPTPPPPIDEIIKFVASEAFVKASIFPGATFVAVLGILSVWYERKLLARVMLRIGPFHVGKYGGWLQVIADAVKFLSKEYIVPSYARRKTYVLMPMVALVVASMLFAVIPFGDRWVIYRSDFSILFFFLLLAVSPIPLILAGWASGSKYSFIGMLRFAFQVFAYEIPLFLALTGVILMARSFDFYGVVNAQSTVPFIIPQIVGFVVWFIALVSEAERIPFDMPTAEQELVQGWQVEYPASGFLMIQLALYTKLDALVFTTTHLYLGGWNGPAIPGLPNDITQPFWVFVKSLILLTVILLMRGVYPRITIKKILDLGWRLLIPLSLINILVAALIAYLPTVF